ncbi:DNA repair helicase RAD25 [Sporothrix curviconia]|uniref:DNA repair helicase RAD25 n=1 Tax=Sporothrix curviconia TaxID=1260050 RepID=A0ABP0BMT4_9PEZI
MAGLIILNEEEDADHDKEAVYLFEVADHGIETNALIGDASLDLPAATCLIQVSLHYGSRRQEAQRLGCISRAKRRNDEGLNAFFYSSRRQAFLVAQGYAFKVIAQLQDIDKTPGLAFTTARQQLQEVLVEREELMEDKIDDNNLWEKTRGRSVKRLPRARRTAGTRGELSGGQGMAYIEQKHVCQQDAQEVGQEGREQCVL